MFLNYVDVWRIPDNAKTASARASPVRRWGRFTSPSLGVSAKHFLLNVICETFEVDCQPVE
jgi:hypothetical protein